MNRLKTQLSPYLLQHAANPVDWYPWGPEALERAAAEQKPIFLSIGYSACHWCHVMAHESFEDPEIARLLNEHFISIKVDREERPDLDQIYMEAVQLLTGRGGWPMSVFLLPDQRPFFGGTYWPPRAQGGMVGFDQVLTAVVAAWHQRRNEIVQQAETILQYVGNGRPEPAEPGELNEALLEGAEAALANAFDDHNGGFGTAPKFPHATDLAFLLRRWRHSGKEDLLQMVMVTLDHMAAGGIFDQLGGGFHRYSVDADWLVPHFEKMLYDNALLASVYAEAAQATDRPDYARVAAETLDYVLRDMTHPEGGFFSAEDADSEGEEGRFYLWTPDEIRRVLGDERARTFCHVYDVTEAGNFEGRNILHLSNPIEVCAKVLGREVGPLEAELADDRARLLVERSKRVRPGRDDKILTSWNGLMIDAFARAGAAMDEPRWRHAAAQAADFLLMRLRDEQGRLLHCWRNGQVTPHGFLDDEASLATALATLYETQGSRRWLDEAVALADDMLGRFADPAGGFYYTPRDGEPLIARKKDLWDTPVPSSTALAVTALLRLARLADREDFRRAAEQSLRSCVGWMEEAPLASGQMLLALDMLIHADQPTAA